MFEVACDSCRRVLDIPDHLHGKRAKCPHCGAGTLLVPSAGFAPEPPAPPPEAAFTGMDPLAHRQAETEKAQQRRVSSLRGFVLVAGIALGMLLGATVAAGGLRSPQAFLPTLGWALVGQMIGIVVLAIPAAVLSSVAVYDRRNLAVLMPEVENIGCSVLLGVVVGSLLGLSKGAHYGSGQSSWEWGIISPASIGAFIGGLMVGGLVYFCLALLAAPPPDADEAPPPPEE